MTSTFEIELTEAQAADIRKVLGQTIASMRTLFFDLHRENARWRSPETDALLAADETELAALQHMADALSAFQAMQGWQMPAAPRALDTSLDFARLAALRESPAQAAVGDDAASEP